MSPDSRTRVESVFEAALECAPAERSEFLERACGDDVGLRRSVQALLAAHERTAGVLEQDVAGVLRSSTAPERAGAYRVGRELGRGGMGAVFLGERADGQFHRRVAIKLIDTPADATLHARIVAERQILATLEHPHIARLLDGGITDDGRPFLVMEHVEGLPIDVYCDRMRLDVRARLRLFLQVVRAVEHAHRNLVVHRDLKPSNIMVSTGGMVKLLDFGIARLLNPMYGPGPVGDTHIERRAFTPEYASPEQLRGEAVNTTSDVYSLGLVLYRLLTGEAAYLAGERPVATLLAERSADPARPSTRLRSRAQQDPAGAAATAHARDSTPARLARTLTGDLDAIVLMALRPEPPHRYGSAELLAQDVERYLDGRPVQARQGSGWYRLQRRIRRHRVQYSAAVIVLLALVSGAGIALWQAREARAERDRAAAALAQTQEISDFLVQLFETGSTNVAGNPQITAQDLVARGVLRAEDLAGQPGIQARMFGVLARVQESLGHYAEARRLSERAFALHVGHAGEDQMAGRLLVQLGIQLRQLAEYDSARRVVARARTIQQRLDPEHPDLGETLNQLRSLAIYQGDIVEAERLARSAYDFWSAARGDTSVLTIDALVNYGAAQRRRGDLAGGVASLREAIALRARLPNPPATDVANDKLLLAEFLVGLDRPGDAAQLYAEVAELEQRAGPEFDNFRTWLWGAQAWQAETRGDHDLAEQLLRRSMDLRRRQYGDAHPSTYSIRGAFASFLGRTGRVAEAERLFQDVLAAQTAHYGPDHPVVAGTLSGISEMLVTAGRVAQADSMLERALRIRQATITRGLSPLVAEMLVRRAMLQVRLGNLDAAAAMLERAAPIKADLHADAFLHGQIEAARDTLETARRRAAAELPPP